MKQDNEDLLAVVSFIGFVITLVLAMLWAVVGR